MADRSDISQAITQVGAGDAEAEVSQASTVVGADDAGTEVSQQAALVGADDADTFISQAAPLVAADDAGTLVYQLVLLVGHGPEAMTAPAPTTTELFDEGGGDTWFLVPVLSDSGDEERDKVLKAISLTGKVTNCTLGVFAFGAGEEIDMAVIEGGNVFSRTNVIPIPNTLGVVRCERQPVNVKAALLHTMRAEGRWDGNGIRDRIEEVTYEQAIQGVRR